MQRLLVVSLAGVASAKECFYDWTVRDHVVDYLHPGLSVSENLPVPPENRLPAQLVNKQYPGPAIECDEDDDVVVVMRNELIDEGVSIHWHGLWMAGSTNDIKDATPWSDGVHHVTQAAILPGQNYTYRFKAYPPGTHFWHSHMDSLQVDRGIKGPIIVHAKNDPHKGLYDEEIIVAMSDARRVPDICLKLEGQEVDVGNPVCNEIDKTSWNGFYGNGSVTYPYPTITIEQGKCYRLRWIAMAGNTQNYQIRIAGHNQTLIALDSYDINPYPVAGFNLHNGERVDSIICGDQEPGNYLINATYDLACELVNDPVFSPLPPVDSCLFYAFIHYKGHDEIPKNIDPSVPGGFPQGTGGGLNATNPVGNFLDLNTQASYQAVSNVFDTSTPAKADYTYTLVGGILGPTPTHDHIHDAPLSGTGRTYLNMQHGDDPGAWSFAPHIPTDPILHTKGKCGTNNAPMLDIPEDAEVVELVLINTTPSAHVFHMHGMAFDVVNYGYPEWCNYEHHDSCFFMLPPAGHKNCEGTLTWSDPDHEPMGGYLYWGCSYNASSPAHTKTLNLQTPLRKDMLSLWRRQWAVVRIYPRNPGVWILHCHMEQHVPTGMIIALNVLPSKQPPVPADVPTSGTCPKNGHDYSQLPAPEATDAVKFELTTNDWIVDYWRPTAIDKLRKWPVGIPEEKRQAAVLFNGDYPAKPMVVNLGDDVEVTLKNDCLGDVVSAHFHGIDQSATPWMDGTAGVSQAPLVPSESFTYKFKASPAGTHFIHSQASGLQGARGAKGAFIVNNPNDPHKAMYKDDIVVTLSDTWQEPENCLQRTEAGMTNNPNCALIDKGQFNGQFGDGSKLYPLYEIEAKAKTCTRMRFIGMMAQVPSFTVSIDSHKLTIIAVDGTDVTPLEVDSFTVYNGERYDAVVCPTKKGQYPVHMEYAAGCNPAVQAMYPDAPVPDTCSFQAVLNVAGPLGEEAEEAKPTGLQLDLGRSEGFAMLKSVAPAPVPVKADAQFVVNMGYLRSSFNGSMYLHTSNTPWANPKTPLAMTKGQCGAEGTPVINVPEEASSIELVINNLTPEEHQVHLHGLRFQVVETHSYPWCIDQELAKCIGMPAAGVDPSVCKNVVKSDSADEALDKFWGCAYSGATAEQNLADPLYKDSINLPRRGYVVLRVDTSTPGFWALQSAAVTDQLRGAQTVLNVLPSKQAAVPANVPSEGPC
jgi:FtsP/CotA-like multicopper oxidase with cupredoxin domain